MYALQIGNIELEPLVLRNISLKLFLVVGDSLLVTGELFVALARFFGGLANIIVGVRQLFGKFAGIIALVVKVFLQQRYFLLQRADRGAELGIFFCQQYRLILFNRQLLVEVGNGALASRNLAAELNVLVGQLVHLDSEHALLLGGVLAQVFDIIQHCFFVKAIKRSLECIIYADLIIGLLGTLRSLDGFGFIHCIILEFLYIWLKLLS